MVHGHSVTLTFGWHRARCLRSVLVISALLWATCCGFFGKTVQTRTAAESSIDATPYVIGADDVLEIIVWKEPQLSGRVLVAADGTATLPLIGPVEARGHTCQQLREELAHRLSAFTRSPNVTVRVSEARSRIYYVLGEVRKPGSFPLRSGEVLSQGLAEAGGLSEFADPGAIRLVRRTGANNIQMTINYERVLSGKDITGDVRLQAGDTITVP